MQNASPPFNPQLIGQTEHALRAILNRQLAGTEVSYPQWVALLLTASAAESTHRDQLAGRVARALKVDHAAAESDFQALASSGLIETETESSSLIMVTPAGQRLVDHIRAQASGITQRLLADLPTADLAAAGRVLSTVLARAEAELAPSSPANTRSSSPVQRSRSLSFARTTATSGAIGIDRTFPDFGAVTTLPA